MASSDTKCLTAYLVTAAAGTDEVVYVTWPLEGEWMIEDAYIVPGTTTALHATNYSTVTITQGGATLGALASDTVAWTAGTARSFTVAENAAKYVGKGDVIAITKSHAGAGAVVEGTISLAARQIRS